MVRCMERVRADALRPPMSTSTSFLASASSLSARTTSSSPRRAVGSAENGTGTPPRGLAILEMLGT